MAREVPGREGEGRGGARKERGAGAYRDMATLISLTSSGITGPSRCSSFQPGSMVTLVARTKPSDVMVPSPLLRGMRFSMEMAPSGDTVDSEGFHRRASTEKKAWVLVEGVVTSKLVISNDFMPPNPSMTMSFSILDG
jgi:hypothetical protein